jgi:hypothetical protein
MAFARAERIVLIAAVVVACSCGALGAFVGYSLEEDHQMHGVEPGPEATWALQREAAIGFVLGTLSGALVAGPLGLLACHLSRRRAAR